MRTIDIVLYVIAAVLFALSIVPALQPVALRLVSAGLLAWVLVGLVTLVHTG